VSDLPLPRSTWRVLHGYVQRVEPGSAEDRAVPAPPREKKLSAIQEAREEIRRSRREKVRAGLAAKYEIPKEGGT